MPTREALLTALILGLAGWGVASQLVPGGAPAPAAAEPLGMGEALDPDIRLFDAAGRRRRVGDELGERATVFYGWSTTCSCIPICDPHLGDLAARLGPAQGVQWWGVAGEPADARSRVAAALEARPPFYGVLLDPAHRLAGPLGLDRSSLVVVLDAEGCLRFRGSPIDALRDPAVFHLAEALAVIAAGAPLPEGEREPAFGCPFGAPLADCPDEEPEG